MGPRGGRRTLFEQLDRLFDDSGTSDVIQASRKGVYATANLALGLLCYGAGRTAAARSFLLQAIRWQPSYLMRPELNRTLARTLIPSWGLAALRSRRRLADSAA